MIIYQTLKNYSLNGWPRIAMTYILHTHTYILLNLGNRKNSGSDGLSCLFYLSSLTS